MFEENPEFEETDDEDEYQRVIEEQFEEGN